MVLYYILNKLGLGYNYNEIEKVKMNLKHTKTLKKKFFIPTQKDILNKMYVIKFKNKPRFEKNEIIKIKNSLKSIN